MKRVYAGPEDGVELQLPDGSHIRLERDGKPVDLPAETVRQLEASGHELREPEAKPKKAAAAAKEA
ncbi:MAG TPA: hypothetical protein VFZ00_01435 [Solirubrobacter sp.]|nr:hypothetical protein [Solirubrobacter sp.]